MSDRDRDVLDLHDGGDLDGRDRDAQLEFGGRYMPVGFQERKIRRYPKRLIPECAHSERALMKALLGGDLRARVCILSWIHGLTSTEVAERVGLTPAAVRQILYRFRKNNP